MLNIDNFFIFRSVNISQNIAVEVILLNFRNRSQICKFINSLSINICFDNSIDIFIGNVIGFLTLSKISARIDKKNIVAIITTLFLKNNYNNLTMEQIHTLLTKDSADVVYWMDNCHDGFRHTYDLDTSVAGWADALKDSGKTIHYMGMAREAGNSPLYIVELTFYQNVMYPELDTGLDFAELFQYFVDNFTEEPEKYAGYDIGDFFKDFGVM